MEILKSVWIYNLILNKEDYLFFRLVFSRKAEISLATYPKGVYFLQIITDKGVVTKKLTLQ